MWIRQDVDWQRDPFIITLDGISRHVLNTVWCLAGKHGTPTFAEDGAPLHGELSLRYLEPSYLANEAGFDVANVRQAMEKLRRPLEGTDYAPGVPAPIEIDVTRGVAVVRNLARYQQKLLKDRKRKQEARGRVHLSADKVRSSADKPETSAEKSRVTIRNVTKRNETNYNAREVEPEPASPPPATPALPCRPEAVKDAWNQVLAPVLPAVSKLTDKRRKAVTARLKADDGRTEPWWFAYFGRIRQTPFLCGENDRGWRADFDFATRSEDVVVSILEGKYDGGSGQRAPVQPDLPDLNAAFAAKRDSA